MFVTDVAPMRRIVGCEAQRGCTTAGAWSIFTRALEYRAFGCAAARLCNTGPVSLTFYKPY